MRMIVGMGLIFLVAHKAKKGLLENKGLKGMLVRMEPMEMMEPMELML
jgi:hypothetical protein